MQKRRLMFAYHDLIKVGKFGAAWNVLRLLQRGSISLGTDDSSWEVEKIAKKLGLRISYGYNYYSARISL